MCNYLFFGSKPIKVNRLRPSSFDINTPENYSQDKHPYSDNSKMMSSISVLFTLCKVIQWARLDSLWFLAYRYIFYINRLH